MQLMMPARVSEFMRQIEYIGLKTPMAARTSKYSEVKKPMAARTSEYANDFKLAICRLLPHFAEGIRGAENFAKCLLPGPLTYFDLLGPVLVRDLLAPWMADPRKRIQLPSPEDYKLTNRKGKYYISKAEAPQTNSKYIFAKCVDGKIAWVNFEHDNRYNLQNRKNVVKYTTWGFILPCGLVILNSMDAILLKNLQTGEFKRIYAPFGMYDDFGKLHIGSLYYDDKSNTAVDFSQYVSIPLRVEVI